MYSTEEDEKRKSLANNKSEGYQKNVHERRLKWYGRAMQREDDYVRRRVMRTEVQEDRSRRGRPQRRWFNSMRDDKNNRIGVGLAPLAGVRC